MAINLTGKSDATLVTAATRAGLATSPKSYQEIFEDVSQTYGETMQAVTESWEEITELTKTIGLEAVENAIYHTKKRNFVESTGMSDEDGEFYIDKLQDIKKRLQGAVGLKERLKINRERDELYAQVDMFDAERKLVLNALASGNVDEVAMGSIKMELLNAIAATGTEKKNTKSGNYFAVTEDPENGEIIYALMKRNPDVQGPVTEPIPVLGEDNKPIVIRAGDTEKSIILKNPQLPIDLTKVRNNVVRSATQIGGVYTDYERDKVRKQYAPFTETSSGLIQALRATWFDNSFYEELTSPGKDGSELSAIIFDTIRKAKGTNEEGNLVKEGVLANVEDKNNDGISKEELKLGYMSTSGAIMNLADEKLTKEIFLNWVEEKSSVDWDYGSRKNKLTNPGGGGGSGDSGGTGFLTTKKGVNSGSLGYYVFPNYDSAKNAYDQFVLASQGKEAEFTIGKANYKFEIKGDNAYKWVETNSAGEKTVKGTTTELIGPRGFAITDSDFRKIEDFEGGTDEDVEKFEGLNEESTIGVKNLHKTLFNTLDVNDDDDASIALNKFFEDDAGIKLTSRRAALQFMPFTREPEAILARGAGGTGFQASDNVLTNDIMLFNPRTGEVVKDESGNRMRFKVGDDMENIDKDTKLSSDITKLLKVLEQYGIKPVGNTAGNTSSINTSGY